MCIVTCGCSFNYSGGQKNVDQPFETMNVSTSWDSGQELMSKSRV